MICWFTLWNNDVPANPKVSAVHVPYPMFYALNETLIINSTLFVMALFLFCSFRNEFHFHVWAMCFSINSLSILHTNYFLLFFQLGFCFFSLVSRLHLVLYILSFLSCDLCTFDWLSKCCFLFHLRYSHTTNKVWTFRISRSVTQLRSYFHRT
jgi:hypothetical protein